MKIIRALNLRNQSINFHYKNSHINLARYYLIADAFCISFMSKLKYKTATEEDFIVTHTQEYWFGKPIAFFRNDIGGKSMYCIELKKESPKPHNCSIS